MKNIEKFNFLNFITNFNRNYTESLEQENNLSSEERKQLFFCEQLLKEISIIIPEYKFGSTDIPTYVIKDEYLETPHICNGGTCSASTCSKIGYLVKCDTGCTYPGA